MVRLYLIHLPNRPRLARGRVHITCTDVYWVMTWQIAVVIHKAAVRVPDYNFTSPFPDTGMRLPDWLDY